MDSAKTAPPVPPPLVSGKIGHPARAYLASLGTAGSMLAGAAILFVVASAFVAFNGWPQAGNRLAPAHVVFASTRSAKASPRLATALASVGAGATSVGAPGAGSRGGLARGGTAPAGRPGGSSVIFAGRAGGRQQPGAGHSLPAPGSPTTTPPAPGGSNSLGAVITSAGSHLGSTVSAVTGHLANRIRPISPAASGVLKHAGRAADRTLRTTSGLVGGVLPGGGK